MKWELSRVAVVDGEVIGYALCSSKGEAVWLHRIAIAQGSRSLGVGAALVCEVQHVARRRGFDRLGLKTPRDNVRARSFYDRLGFSLDAEEGDYATMSIGLRSGVVGIHQPNFIPWLGYFSKMHRSDAFIILDDVLAPSRGYFNRAKVLVQGSGKWLTVPVHRGDGYINHMKPSGDEWVSKHVRTLQHSYQKAPYFEQVMPGVSQILEDGASLGLSELNLRLIKFIAATLGVSTDISLASDFSVSSTGDQRLVELVSRVGGSAYLSGKGGDNYQLPQTFEQAGIDLLYTGFDSPAYDQPGVTEFVPGLSALDALFNVGPAGTRALLDKVPLPASRNV